MNLFCRKTRLITRDDLIIDWRTFYRWIELIHNNHDESYALVTLPKFVVGTFGCKRHALFYFLEDSNFRYYGVCSIALHTFRKRPLKKFLMNFDHVYVHLIQFVEM